MCGGCGGAPSTHCLQCTRVSTTPSNSMPRRIIIPPAPATCLCTTLYLGRRAHSRFRACAEYFPTPNRCRCLFPNPSAAPGTLMPSPWSRRSYEAVHPVRSMAELKARLGKGRRCFAFFHPCLPEEPLVFVHVALLPEVAASMADIVGLGGGGEEEHGCKEAEVMWETGWA